MPRNDPDFDDDNDDETPQDDSKAIKQMRARIKEQEKELADLAQARREIAMLRAGVDLESKLGKMFAKSFDGDLSDIDAIKAEATELGLVKGIVTPEPEPEPTPTNDTPERQTLSNGALPDEPDSTVDAKGEAMAKAETALKSGMTWEKAAGGFINELANAAYNGDQSVLVRS